MACGSISSDDVCGMACADPGAEAATGARAGAGGRDPGGGGGECCGEDALAGVPLNTASPERPVRKGGHNTGMGHSTGDVESSVSGALSNRKSERFGDKRMRCTD